MQFDWSYTLGLFWSRDFWSASLTVVELSLLSWLIAIVLGFGLALCMRSSNMVVARAAGLYIWLFRSVPLLVLLIFTYNMPQMFPSTSAFLSKPFFAGLIAMVLSETAYIAEIHRGGLMAVQRGQAEAGKALGIGAFGIQRLIIIPQALRVALPALANEYISIVKLTSLVSVISLSEILLVGQRMYTQNFKVLETMLGVTFYYVFIVTIFTVLLRQLERYLDVTRHVGEMSAVTGDMLDLKRWLPAADSRRDMPVIELKNGRKSFGMVDVLKDINLCIDTGQVVSVIGPSGSGKSTLIRSLNGLEPLDHGEVLLQGARFLQGRRDTHRSQERTSRKRILDIGMVFQSFNLFPHKSVLGNVMLAPRYHGLGSDAEIRQLALAMLRKVGMAAHANKYPHQLSGGQQQRVAIARALAMRPSIILFDEPTSALDPETVGEVLRVIRQLAAEGTTMVIVTHEMQFALDVSSRILFMENGRVEFDGPPDALRQTSTRDRRVRDFMFGVDA
ncbi:amino acid ABC transporter permease/ATP-binding protein [Mesorhizobium shangrilense]|uniref:Amino acid ABC transporter permease/ATP-binding protein n=1 Tax=Mesorhizobium shangrilense TaxID=460060 RepID=A0ABV2D8H3_9HYPH